MYAYVFDIHWAGFLVYDRNQCFGLGLKPIPKSKMAITVVLPVLFFFSVSLAIYKCDQGLCRYWLSRDFSRPTCSSSARIIPNCIKNYFVSLTFAKKGHKVFYVATQDYPITARTSSLKSHDNKYWAPMTMVIAIIWPSGSYND